MIQRLLKKREKIIESEGKYYLRKLKDSSTITGYLVIWFAVVLGYAFLTYNGFLSSGNFVHLHRKVDWIINPSPVTFLIVLGGAVFVFLAFAYEFEELTDQDDVVNALSYLDAADSGSK